MRHDVRVAGQPATVIIERGGSDSEYVVEMDGRRWIVDAVWIDHGTLSVREEGAAREVRFDGVFAETGGRRCRVEALSRAEGAASEAPPVGAPGRIVVRAPMPGRIVRVLVGSGERVAARQPLVIVEAMKMENALRAPREGVVSEVAIAAGAAVEAGAVLLAIDG